MSTGDVTRLLQEMRGDKQAAEHLLPLVYRELRRVAAGSGRFRDRNTGFVCIGVSLKRRRAS